MGWSSRLQYPAGAERGLLFVTASRLILGPTQHPFQWVSGTFAWEVKWPGCEADHLP